MASTKHKVYSCLICLSSSSPVQFTQIDNLDILFLLRILFEIPKEHELVQNIKDSLNSIQICAHCVREIKQSKDIYSEIGEKIEGFWKHQNTILEKFSTEQISSKNKIENNDWVFQCRKFVKDHDFTGFGYPFAVHDLETLLTTAPSKALQLKDDVNSITQTELLVNSPENNYDSHQNSEDPFEEMSSPFSQPSEQNEDLNVKQEPESEEEVTEDEDNNLSSDRDYQPSPSKKSKISPAKRKSTRNKDNQAKRQSNQIKERNRRKPDDYDYPDFKRDPISKKFHCTWSEDCGEKFVVKHSLNYHWDRHKGIPRQNCEECPQAFYSKRELVCHRQKEHPKEGDKFDCEKCGKNYKTREAFLRHQRNSHDEKKEMERIAKMMKKEEDPIKRDPLTNKWKCYWEKCDKSYLERTDLKYHLDRHRGTPQQKCGECGQLFYSRCQLVEHKEREHEKDKKFDCKICGDKFDTSSKLYLHKTLNHSENGKGAQVVCQICGKTFKKVGLYSHMRGVHGSVEERKFVCHLCPKRFVDLRGMKRHLWWVHKFCEKEEDREKFEKYKEREKQIGKNWTCHVKGCRMKFATEEGLKQHVDGVHKGNWDDDEDMNWKFNCEICGKGFHVKQKFTRHVKQHEK